MAKPILPDDLWSFVGPLLPPDKPAGSNGRPAVRNRQALTGILFVLRTGIPWEYLPQEMGCGSGMTCWRRLHAWQEQGRMATHIRSLVGPPTRGRCHRLVARGGRQRIRPSRFWGQKTGPTPTDRRKAGSKHPVLTDAQGLPLAFTLTGANTHDATQLLPLADAIPPVRGKPGRPRRKPERVQGDRGYDSEPHRRALRARHITPVLAKRNTEHGSGLGETRWVVERTLAWLHAFRRLRVRYERRADIHEAFLTIACAMICFNRLKGFC